MLIYVLHPMFMFSDSVLYLLGQSLSGLYSVFVFYYYPMKLTGLYFMSMLYIH